MRVALCPAVGLAAPSGAEWPKCHHRHHSWGVGWGRGEVSQGMGGSGHHAAACKILLCIMRPDENWQAGWGRSLNVCERWREGGLGNYLGHEAMQK